MPGSPRDRTPPRPAPSRPGDRRKPPPPRLMPDDSLFRASLNRLCDASSTDVDRRFAALAPLPTPVEQTQCTQMWIPAGRVAADFSLREVLASLDSDSQPQVWRDAKPHLRDFNTSPRNGISFVCTSDQVLQRLGGVELMICGEPVAIRRYSSYDKLYYVDLRRLPADTTDLAIYDWFVARGVRPILITPTLGVGQLISRARTVYFNAVQCPDALFEPNGEPLREIYFTDGEKPCFVQHRLFRLNRVKPPSLRQPPRKTSGVSDASMRGPDDVAAPPQDSSTVLSPVDSSAVSSPLDSSLDTSAGPSRTPSDHSRSQDPHALVYSIPVSPNTYDVLHEDGFDDSLPPDTDLAVAHVDDDEMSTPVSGYTADSELLPHMTEVRVLKNVRRLDLKVDRLSAEELQREIDSYLAQEVLEYTTHEDVLAAIQVQPAYFRRIFRVQADRQAQLVKAHAVYRAICAEPVLDGESDDYLDRLRSRYESVDSVDAAAFFECLFPGKPQQEAVFHSALCDLFLMVFAPAVYIDPVKIQAVLPSRSPPKRIRTTPFLLWSDLTLMYVARCDVGTSFAADPRTPTTVTEALTHLASVDIPSAVAGSSRLVHPRL